MKSTRPPHNRSVRKLTTAALLLVFIALLADVGILAISSALDSEAENAVMAYAAALEQYKALHGHYPEAIDDIAIQRNSVAFIFGPSEIRYLGGESAALYYHQFPLGPKHVYSLNTKEWRFED